MLNTMVVKDIPVLVFCLDLRWKDFRINYKVFFYRAH